MNLIPGLGLRADEESEILGIDDAEIGEFAVSLVVVFARTLTNVLKVRLCRAHQRGTRACCGASPEVCSRPVT
jgi:hypothetical protein